MSGRYTFVMSWIKDHHVMSLTFESYLQFYGLNATAKVELGKKLSWSHMKIPNLM